MTQNVPAPIEIRLADAGRRLDVLWTDGVLSRLPAGELRRASRSAGALRAAIDGRADAASLAVTIADVEAVGAYAVRLVFSDGHDRGIFPFSYLRDLAAA